MRNAQVTIMSGSDVASKNGTAYDVGQVVSASFQISFSDTAIAGTVRLQACNDLVDNRMSTNGQLVHWTDIPSASSTIVAGVAPMLVIPNMTFSFIRAVLTQTTPGTGTILVNMNVLSL